MKKESAISRIVSKSWVSEIHKENSFMTIDNVLQAKQLQYLPDDFKVTTWSKLNPYYSELEKRTIESVEDLEKWIVDMNELMAVVGEEFNWRYVRVSQNTEDQKAAELYQYAIQELYPKISPVENRLNQKLVNSPFLKDLPANDYFIYTRGVQKQTELFRKENIPLSTQDSLKAKDYGEIISKMTVEIDGEEMTLQKAGTKLEEPDRELRASVYKKIGTRVAEDRQAMDDLFDELMKIRHQMALNAGFENYRDYKFQSMGRFDYEVQDCYDFHESIAKEVVPVNEALIKHRKKELGLETLRPWDLSVDTTGKAPLKPFETIEELIQKSAVVLGKLHPFFGESLKVMQQMERLDLGSRKGKHAGGYNMPLYYSGVPFIFMNATSSFGDLRTLMHESGHAVHAMLTHDYDLVSAKSVPSEVAELAAMTMELITMDHWDVFFENEDDLRRAKVEQLEGVLKTLPWVATIDKFQHWIYTNPNHSQDEREIAWAKIYKEFSSNLVDTSGLEKFVNHRWHRQLHLFEVPFYYIEYGMAQLGAIAIWKRYRETPDQALKDYIKALKLGYTKKIGEIYQAAGIEFNFSQEYVKELADFVKKELEKVI